MTALSLPPTAAFPVVIRLATRSAKGAENAPIIRTTASAK